MNIGKSIKVACKQSGKKQQDIANHFGIKRQQVSQWACSTNEMTWKNTRRIAEFFGLKVSEFIALGED